MSDESKGHWGRIDVGGLVGPLWFAGWLFTIGYLHLHLVRALIALLVWPYFLGTALGH
jgi:hypothetical protein